MTQIYADIEFVEKYLTNKLNKEEQEELKLKVIMDEEFQMLLDIMKILIRCLRYTGSHSTLAEKLEKLGGFRS